MRKILSVLLIILTLSVVMTGCKNEERKEIEAEYINTAETIFANYFEKNYPEKNYEVKDLQVLKDKKIGVSGEVTPIFFVYKSFSWRSRKALGTLRHSR